MPGISCGFSVIEDLASLPRPVRTISPPSLGRALTMPKGTSRATQASPPSTFLRCSARIGPAGTVTLSQPTTWALAQRRGAPPAAVFLALRRPPLPTHLAGGFLPGLAFGFPILPLVVGPL